MKISLRSRDGSFFAEGEFKKTTNEVIVKKGAKVSENVVSTAKMPMKKIIALRKQYIESSILNCNLVFKSPSAASNFVAGYSTNGWEMWKVDKKKSLKDFIKGEEDV